jgi:hypothetical protein
VVPDQARHGLAIRADHVDPHSHLRPPAFVVGPG